MKGGSVTPGERKWMKWLLLAAALEIVGLVAYTAYHTWYTLSNPVPIEIVEPCPWWAQAHTWIDLNRNGSLDPGEPPLSDVDLIVEGFGPRFHSGGRTMTDWNGDASLAGLYMDCNDATLEVVPSVPAGYQLTTPSRLKIDPDNWDRLLEFGFAYLPGAPTVTPRPPQPACTSTTLASPPFGELTDLGISPNGTIWVSGTRVSELPPGSSEWLGTRKLNAPKDFASQSVAVESDTSVWFAGFEQAWHFDGTTWTAYGPPGVSTEDRIRSLSPDGRLVWFATEKSLWMLDLQTNEWREFTPQDLQAPSARFVLGVGTSADGSVWVSTDYQLSRALWPSRPEGGPVWQRVSNLYNAAATRILAGPNDTVWFGGMNWPLSFDLKTGKWQSPAIPLESIAFRSSHVLAFGGDSSLWFGSGTHSQIFHLLHEPSDDPNSWRSYDLHGSLPELQQGYNGVRGIAVAPDGALWVATASNVARCVFSER